MVIYLDEVSEFDKIKIRRIIEGSTKYWIPDPSYYGKKGFYLPFELPIFYNPNMEINRDLSIIATMTYLDILDRRSEDILYVEALAGSGIRGFRLANEVGPLNIVINDINPLAYRFMQFNTKFFPSDISSRIIILNYDANYLLNSIKFWQKSVDILDIDPFGSPAPFLDSAIRALRKNRGLLLITATDIAPLIGKFPKSAKRRYYIDVQKSLADKEIGIRALIFFAFRLAAKYRVALKPLFAFSFQHFYKICFTAIPGRKVVDKLMENIGWVSLNGEITIHKKYEDRKLIGPIWLGSIYDTQFLDIFIKNTEKSRISQKNKEKLLEIAKAERNTATILFYYNLERIASQLKRRTPKTVSITKKLRELGYIAEKTHFEPKAIKTNAPIKVIEEIIKNME